MKRLSRPSRQRGFALIFLATLLGIIFLAYFLTSITPTQLATQRDIDNQKILEKIKQEILNTRQYDSLTALRDNQNLSNFGLFCPTLSSGNARGTSFGQGANTAATSCTLQAPVALPMGLLPWGSMSLADHLDKDGNRIWYVVSPQLNQQTGSSLSASGVSYDADTNAYTPYNFNNFISIRQEGSTTTAPIDYAAFALISPGPLMGKQKRPQNDFVAPVGGNFASFDLDGDQNENNYTLGGSLFIKAVNSQKFNDVVVYESAYDYIKWMEKQVAQVAFWQLNDYITQCKGSSGTDCVNGIKMPFAADPATCQSGTKPVATGGCNRSINQLCQGNYPADVVDSVGNFNDNGWPQQIYFAIFDPASRCKKPIQIQGRNFSQPINAVLIFPGLSAGTTRPAPAAETGAAHPTYLNRYLDVDANKIYDADFRVSLGTAVTYTVPPATSHDLLCIYPQKICF